MKQNKTLLKTSFYDTIVSEANMKLSRADIQMIELKNKVKLLITKQSKEHLRAVLEKSMKKKGKSIIGMS